MRSQMSWASICGPSPLFLGGLPSHRVRIGWDLGQGLHSFFFLSGFLGPWRMEPSSIPPDIPGQFLVWPRTSTAAGATL